MSVHTSSTYVDQSPTVHVPLWESGWNLPVVKFKGVALIFKVWAEGSLSALLKTVYKFTWTVCMAHPFFVREIVKWVLFGHIHKKLSVWAHNLQGHVHMLNFKHSG